MGMTVRPLLPSDRLSAAPSPIRLAPMRLFVLTLLLAGTASAQEVTLYPGHPDLEVSALTPADVTQDIRIVEPEAQPIGLNIQTARLDGDVLTVVTRTGAAGSRYDSTRVSWPTLAPISQTIASGNGEGSATYTGAEIRGSFTNGETVLPFELALPSVAFPQSVLPYVVRALPLDQTGYEATAPVFSPQSRLTDVYLTVEGPETVTLPDGTTTEAVAVSQTGGSGGPQRHFVDARTRDLVLTEIRSQGRVIRSAPVTADELAAIQAADAAAAAEVEAARAEAARNQLTPGTDVLTTVAPQTVTYTVLLTQPAQQELGSIAVTETLDGDRLTIVSNAQIPAAGQNTQDSTVVAYPSLAPISREQVTPAATKRLRFADGRVTGTAMEGGETTEFDAAVDGAFGPGITRTIIRSLPFAEGYATSFAQIDNDGERSVSFLTVTGQEAYTRPDGTETTVWVVEETGEDGPDSTYYVDAETRELLKMALAPQPGVAIEMVAQ